MIGAVLDALTPYECGRPVEMVNRELKPTLMTTSLRLGAIIRNEPSIVASLATRRPGAILVGTTCELGKSEGMKPTTDASARARVATWRAPLKTNAA
jgi:hypothetical protein